MPCAARAQIRAARKAQLAFVPDGAGAGGRTARYLIWGACCRCSSCMIWARQLAVIFQHRNKVLTSRKPSGGTCGNCSSPCQSRSPRVCSLSGMSTTRHQARNTQTRIHWWQRCASRGMTRQGIWPARRAESLETCPRILCLRLNAFWLSPAIRPNVRGAPVADIVTLHDGKADLGAGGMSLMPSPGRTPGPMAVYHVTDDARFFDMLAAYRIALTTTHLNFPVREMSSGTRSMGLHTFGRLTLRRCGAAFRGSSSGLVRLFCVRFRLLSGRCDSGSRPRP